MVELVRAGRSPEEPGGEFEPSPVLGAIRVIHAETDFTYGAPRVHAELPARETKASRNRVARVMREAGIRGVSRCKGTRTTWCGATAPWTR